MAADGDRERAVKEVAQVYERIKAHHPLLLLHYCSSPSTTTTTTNHHHLAQSLLGDALRALNVALSVMKQQPPPPAAAAGGGPVMTPRSVVVKAEPRQLSPRSPASADSQAAVATITARRANKKRRSSVMMEQATGKTSSWVDLTTVPYEDGYEWRKYGEKKINGTSYTRNYFRCTYKDDTGCLATKHVQQQDSDNSSDPPMFQVTYNNHHTCSSSSSKGAAAAAMNNIKQEQPPPVLLPPLIEVSAALPFDGTPPLMSASPAAINILTWCRWRRQPNQHQLEMTFSTIWSIISSWAITPPTTSTSSSTYSVDRM